MSNLAEIDHLGADQRELLEAAGWVDLRQLAKSNAATVHAEIQKANGMLRILSEDPELEDVSRWVAVAKDLMGEPAEVAEPVEESEPVAETIAEVSAEVGKSDGSVPAMPTGPVNYEADPDVQEMLKIAPVAIPIPNRMLAENQISPSEIAIAPVLDHAESDLEIRAAKVTKKDPAPIRKPQPRSSGVQKVADFKQAERAGIDQSRVRGFDKQDESVVKPLQREVRGEDDRLTLLRTAREATNRGRSPDSEFYIRGVLHDRPFRVWIGCLVVVLFQVAVPLSVVAALLLILSQQLPEDFNWVPDWVIAVPLALPVLGLLYFILSMGVKCRVCGQKVLVPRHCRKNKKAHHVPGLGYIMPLAVHTLIFRWFNCTFCGTSVRIKE